MKKKQTNKQRYVISCWQVESKVPGLLGKGPIAAPAQLNILPPSTGDEYDSDQGSEMSDDDNRPLTQNELKQKIMKGVSHHLSLPQKKKSVCAYSMKFSTSFKVTVEFQRGNAGV